MNEADRSFMTSPISIHHINFIVSDLEGSVMKYSNLLGLGPFEFDDLPERGARTARVNLGDSWLVLVCPTRMNSVPGQFLEANGEGFFLLSLGINDLDSALEHYGNVGVTLPGAKARSGLMDWRVFDLQTEEALGVKFHLTEVNKKG